MPNIKHKILLAALLVFTVSFPFVAYVMQFGPVKIVRSYVLVYALYVLSGIDLETKTVPNRILLVLLGVRIILFVPEAVLYPGYLGNFVFASAAGALLSMAVLAAGNLICKHGMGMGDIKLFGVAGCYVGMGGVIVIMFFSLFFAALCSGVLLLRKRLRAKDEIPFVPFIFAGTIVTFLLGI